MADDVPAAAPAMTDERLAEIRARAEAATPGPWIQDGKAVPWSPRQRSPFADRGAGINSDGQQVVVGGYQDELGGAVGIMTNEDADFIAHARTDVPALLTEIDRLRAALTQTKAVAGVVCHEFEVCDHPSCRSSHAAWEIADAALRGDPTS